MLEQALTQHLGGISGSGSASELLAQALKNISPVSESISGNFVFMCALFMWLRGVTAHSCLTIDV